MEFNDRRRSTAVKKSETACEVCSAKKHETSLYRYGGTVYCEQDLGRAQNEGWHPGSTKVTEVK